MLEPKDNAKFAPSSPNSFSPAPQRTAVNNMEQATIGRSLVIKGEVTGSESLYIDGRVEGTINLPESRVTVGRTGSVQANVTAREVVVMGKISGNLSVSDRLDIRSEGSLTGDVVTARLSIEDGAFFKGSVDLKRGHQKDAGQNAPIMAQTTDKPATMAAVAGKA